MRLAPHAGHRMRYFTPGHEMDLCGHATIAAIFALYQAQNDKRDISIETKAGILGVRWDGEKRTVRMDHARPAFKPFKGSRKDLAGALGIEERDISADLPLLYGSTGTWTLLVPVAGEDALSRMNPSNRDFPNILQEMPRSSIHPFSSVPAGTGYDFAARHFSSPFAGTREDPVTGTASGVMGAYAMAYLHPGSARMDFTVSQGRDVGRGGRVFIHATRETDGIHIAISGKAVFVKEMRIEY